MQKRIISCSKCDFDKILLTNSKNLSLISIYRWTRWHPAQLGLVGSIPLNHTRVDGSDLSKTQTPNLAMVCFGPGRGPKVTFRNCFSNQWSVWPCEDAYQLSQWCVKHNLSRAANIKFFRNPTMKIVSNFSLSHTTFNRLNEMTYVMGIDFWKLGQVWCNCLPDSNNLCDNE